MLPENLALIPLTERTPNEDQDVIGWNGVRLVAAKYVKRLYASDSDHTKVEEVFMFQTEKYPCELDRSITTFWRDITHWMPATL